MPVMGVVSYSDVLAAEEISLEARELPGTVLDAIRRGGASSGGRDALVFMPDASTPNHVYRFSYDDLIEAISRVACGFTGGIDPYKSYRINRLAQSPGNAFRIVGRPDGGCCKSGQPAPGTVTDVQYHRGSRKRVTGYAGSGEWFGSL